MPPSRHSIITLVLLFLFCLFGVTASWAQTGTGLTGRYYDDPAFSSLKTTRLDPALNFNFGATIPTGTGITHADSYSIAWSGQIEAEFTALYTFYVTADDGARLWVNDQMVVCRTFAATVPEMRGQVQLQAGQRVNIRVEYIEQTGNASVKLEWSCGLRPREVVPTNRLYPVREAKVGGSLMKEHWTGISGTDIASLTGNANYPAKPSGREFITSFECLSQNWADSYGTRVTGYIVPPVTGSYTFAVSGDEVVDLYLSTDATAANKSLLARATAATAFRSWGTPSVTRTLVQGQLYYVELLHKEATGSDHWSVGWKKPGDTAFSVVPGSALVQPGTTTPAPAQANFLDTTARDHPRLFATPERFARLRAAWLSPTDSQQKTWANTIITEAEKIKKGATNTYPTIRGTILYPARELIRRVYTLGVAYHITQDRTYADRAYLELKTGADLPNWNPTAVPTDPAKKWGSFLDTAEMTHAFAVGYDWFYNSPYWTTDKRNTIRAALIEKGLKPGLAQMKAGAKWIKPDNNNWSMVCNGGMAMGALAIGSEDVPLATETLSLAVAAVRPVWNHITADNGGWYEGAGYWGYATDYGIRMIAALEGVLGSDFGLSTVTNLAETGFSPLYLTGPSKITFSFADVSPWIQGPSPISRWLARRYNQPLYNWLENHQSKVDPLSTLWWEGSTTSPSSLGASPDMAFHGEVVPLNQDPADPSKLFYIFRPQEVVAMRGNWTDPRTTYIGVKGGQMGADHGHLDAGNFVLDALGKRWFHDLGSDDYGLKGWSKDTVNPTGTDRWDYYRTRPEGHNTLVINPGADAGMIPDSPASFAPLIAYQSEPGGGDSFTIHDLTSVYTTPMAKVWRGVSLLDARSSALPTPRNQVLVQDEIKASTGQTASVWWFAHFQTQNTPNNPFATTVEIDPTDPTCVMLTQGTDRLWGKILSGGGQFIKMEAKPLPTSPNPDATDVLKQKTNAEYGKLAIQLINVKDTSDTTLAVWFVPLSPGETPPSTPPTIKPLNTWSLVKSNHAPIVTSSSVSSTGGGELYIDLRKYVNDDKTASEQLLFRPFGAVDGIATLQPDGYTVHFVPTPGYTGVPSFKFNVTDNSIDANTLLTWDFDLPGSTTSTLVADGSGNGREGTLVYAGAGAASYSSDRPASLMQQGARSLDLIENTTSAASVQRVITTAELNWNTGNWSVAGWFKRRDTSNHDFIWHIGAGDGFGVEDELYLYCPSGTSTVRLQHFKAAGAALDVDLEQTGILAGKWYHFAIVRNGTTLQLYLDGNLVGTDTSFALALSQTAPLVFGSHASATSSIQHGFDGGLDELLVRKDALSPTKISQLATNLSVRHLSGLTRDATITVSATEVSYLWKNRSTASVLPWSIGTNWQAGSAPTSSRGATVNFFTAQTLAGGTISSNNDTPGAFQLNTLTLAGTSSAATTVVLSGGSFTLLNNGDQLPTVNLDGTSASSTNSLKYIVNSPLSLGTDTTFNATKNGTFIFNGAISGTGGLLRTGTSSKLILAGANTYTGTTTIESGTLQIGNDTASGSLGTGDVINDGQLRFERTGILEVPNNISGTGSLYIDCPPPGTIVLSGTNTFEGDVTVNSGTLRITNSSAFGDSTKTITLTNGSGSPQLRLDGSSQPIELPDSIDFMTSNNNVGAIYNEAGNNTLNGPLTLMPGSTRVYAQGGTLTLAGPVTTSTTGSGRTLGLMGAGNGEISGVISNGSAANLLSLSKDEPGTWTLSGDNTYSGSTSVLAGTLKLGSPTALGHGGFTQGNSNGSTTLTAGATLDLNGQTDINEVLTLRGTGAGGGGALINSSSTTARIGGGTVSAIATTAGGLHSVVPEVILSGGAGSGAMAVATLGLTAASFTIDGGTTVYATAPYVTISDGDGTGATATAILTGGKVTGITLTNPGAGYTSEPLIDFNGGTVTTPGTEPTGTGNAANFTVAGIRVTAPGSGYSSAPTVTFSTGTGTTATAALASVALLADTSIGGAGDVVIQPGITGGNTKLTKVGPGRFTLKGTNTYTGTTTVNEGILQLDGSLTSNVTVLGTFIHRGPVTGNVTVAAGGLDAPDTAPGLRPVTGNYSLAAGATLRVLLNGATPGTQHDQLTVGGTVTLGGSLDVMAGPNLLPGSTFTILNKTSSTTTTTTFVGKADNTPFTSAGYKFRINYNAGTGNDIVLTLVTTPLEEWRAANFGSILNTREGADTADPDGDGIKNLIEYAVGGNPKMADGQKITMTVSPDNKLQISFLRARADVTYTVEATNSLTPPVTWTPIATYPSTVSALIPVTVTATDTVPISATSPHRFLHLRVTVP